MHLQHQEDLLLECVTTAGLWRRAAASIKKKERTTCCIDAKRK